MRTLDFIGLDESKVQGVTNGLAQLLADLQVYYTNLRNFHWNVKGHAFFTMHAKFEELYNDTAAKIDEVAERILQLGAVPESRFSAYLKVADVKEVGEIKDGHDVYSNLLETYKILIARERNILEVASDAKDESTVSLMSDFLKEQEKTVWMLIAASDKHCHK